jgi:anti-sigma B factor antagonist
MLASDDRMHIADYALDGRTHCIEMGGQLDLYSTPAFKQRVAAVLEQGKTHVIVDLAGVTFMDSTTLGVLVGMLKRLRSLDGALALVVTDYDIERLFKLTGLYGTFTICRSRDEALEALAHTRPQVTGASSRFPSSSRA